jgi:hypothetical protein
MAEDQGLKKIDSISWILKSFHTFARLKIQPEHDIKPGAVRSGLCRKPIFPFITIFFGIMRQAFKNYMATCTVWSNVLLQPVASINQF